MFLFFILVFVFKELKKLCVSVVIFDVVCVTWWISLSLFPAIKGTWDDILAIDDCLERGSVVALK